MKPARRIFLVFVILLLVACQVPILPGLATPTPLPTYTPTLTFTATASPTATETQTPTITPTPAPLARRVLILSIDGLRPDAIALAPMPNLLALMQTSAYTLNAQTIFPSATLPSHASMLTGYCPSMHGVDWNDYIPERGFAIGTDIFDLASQAGLETWMFVGKKKLQQLTEANLKDFVYVADRDSVIADRVLEEFPENFGLLFIHFALVDGMGHEHGWLSPEQLSVAFRADEAFGKILNELDARDLRDETLIIVTADHGGHDTTHGSSRPEDMTIPWIASGPGVQFKQLTSPVHTMDTAATAAFALGLDAPDDWDGVPVYEAFGLPVEKQSAQCPR
jgi:arylsulfatase A-like enzyme